MTAKGGWPRASFKTRSMVPAEAARESNSEADGKTGRAGEIQPAIRRGITESCGWKFEEGGVLW
jgi:hypothetical protein